MRSQTEGVGCLCILLPIVTCSVVATYTFSPTTTRLLPDIDQITILDPSASALVLPTPSTFPDVTHFPTSSDLLSATPIPTSMTGMTSLQMPATPYTPQAKAVSIIAANLSSIFSGVGECSCDLLVGRCDVYCCCDDECTEYLIQTFQCHATPIGICIDFDILETSLEECSCSDSALLCIARDQNPSRLRYTTPEYVTNANDFLVEWNIHHREGDLPLLHMRQARYGNMYKAGDPVLVKYSNGFSGYFPFPSAMNSRTCHDSNPIAYLEDYLQVCQRQVDITTCLSDPFLNPMNTFSNYKIFQVPSGDSALSIEVYIEQITCQDEFCDLSSPLNTYLADMRCNNILLEAEYTFFHNGTGEISNATVNLVLGSYSSGQSSIIQTYAVTFKQIDDAVEVLRRSGKPGYVHGEPVLGGSLKEGTINITTSDRYWLTILDNCEEVINVRFGQDMMTACSLKLSMDYATDICQRIEYTSVNTLSPKYGISHVGIYGNSDPSDLSQWVPIIIESPENDAQTANPLFCGNVITALQINILYAKTGDFDSAKSVITGVRYVYTAEDVLFQCKECCSSCNFSIILTTVVSFTDVSVRPSPLLESTTSAVHKLPNDFFYPFLVQSASAQPWLFTSLCTPVIFCGIALLYMYV